MKLYETEEKRKFNALFGVTGSGARRSGSDDPAGHVHHAGVHQLQPAAGRLHQGGISNVVMVLHACGKGACV